MIQRSVKREGMMSDENVRLCFVTALEYHYNDQSREKV